MANDDKFSQAARRRARVMRDQHGDLYDTVVEIATGRPTGPISARLKAPLPVPPKYLKPSLTDDTRLMIDYDSWEADEAQAQTDWDIEALKHASQMYGDAAAQKLEEMPPALFARTGKRPSGAVLVQQRRIGNRWLRGVPGAEMPEGAKQYFPEPAKQTTEAWEGAETVETVEFPVWGGPSNGWVTSDRRKFGTDKETALAHQKQLDGAFV